MPTYQYRCGDCRETFERVERISEHQGTHPRCPKCGGENVTQLLGTFFARTSKKS